jgi:hypothetical protein
MSRLPFFINVKTAFDWTQHDYRNSEDTQQLGSFISKTESNSYGKGIFASPRWTVDECIPLQQIMQTARQNANQMMQIYTLTSNAFVRQWAKRAGLQERPAGLGRGAGLPALSLLLGARGPPSSDELRWPTFLRWRPTPRHDALPLRIRRRGRPSRWAGAGRLPAGLAPRGSHQGQGWRAEVGPHTPPPRPRRGGRPQGEARRRRSGCHQPPPSSPILISPADELLPWCEVVLLQLVGAARASQ